MCIRDRYSPDLAPSDFHLFRYLKEFLGGNRFATDDEVKEAVKDWLYSQAADFGIQKLVERYDKCLNKNITTHYYLTPKREFNNKNGFTQQTRVQSTNRSIFSLCLFPVHADLYSLNGQLKYSFTRKPSLCTEAILFNLTMSNSQI